MKLLVEGNSADFHRLLAEELNILESEKSRDSRQHQNTIVLVRLLGQGSRAPCMTAGRFVCCDLSAYPD